MSVKDIRKSTTPVIKTCTEVTTFLGHANQQVDSIRRTNIAMSLPKDLYPLAKYLSMPSEWIFGEAINAKINNIKNQQKAFEIGKTFFKSENTFHRQTYFPRQNSKNWERFLKIPGNHYKGCKD